MSNVLGAVRYLQMITHFMMMQIVLSETAVLFYAQIIEFAVFDIVPTQYIYPLLFFFKSDSAFSEEAEAIGYASRYFIINTGSVTIFILAKALLHLLIQCATKIC